MCIRFFVCGGVYKFLELLECIHIFQLTVHIDECLRRVAGLEVFINKIAGHPLAQNERCLHMFLQEPNIDRNYVPGKIRNT